MSESDNGTGNNGTGPSGHIPPEGTLPIALEEEMRRSYLDYAMSVIVARALPDVRDGLKPVHRRILFSMQENGFTADKPYKKSARVVGDVMGKYHPHGDSAIYDAMVRMAQTFSLRVPLIDGQGNFGSMDGDPPAAMRYTEARLAKSAVALLEGIDEDTVDFAPNYDESAQEPRVLPAAFPNLLVNGANGIAVGMATNIPTHNPGEVIDATLALIAEPETSLEDLMKIMPGPDFPTGALILGRAGIRSAFETGRGSIVLRARAEIEEMRGGRSLIAISEIPYQVNKAALIERIAELVRAKQIEGISDLRDESDRSGLRIVIELKKDATPEVVLNHLYRYTNLQTSFAVNFLALHQGRPQQMGLRQALQAFIDFREEVILRRSRFRLAKARDRGHLLVGLAIAVANIDEVIRLIRESPDAVTARTALMARDWPVADVGPLLALVDDSGNIVTNETVKLTEAQARGILELRLQRLTGLERDKINAELDEVAARIRELLEILASHPRRMELMADELRAVRAQIASPRLSEIVDGLADQDDESLVEPGLMVVTLTRDGYVKRTPLETFRAQNRGGRGRSSANMRQDDVVIRSFNAHTHQWVLFFTSRGMAFREKVWKLPEAGPTARGRSLRQLLQLREEEYVTAVLPLPQDEGLWDNLHLVFATSEGNVRRNRLSDFKNVRASGLIAMKLDEGDSLIGVSTCREGDNVMLATRSGRAIRFTADVDTLRVFAGRDSTGVRGIKLATGDQVIALSVLRHVEASVEERAAYLKQAAQKRRNGEEAAEAAAEAEASLAEENAEAAEVEIALSAERFAELEEQEEILLTVTDGGFGKRSSAYEYRVTGRGGQGITNITLSSRTGRSVVATFPVRMGDDVMLVTDNGRLIRLPADQVRVTGRQAMGVMMLRLNEAEKVTSCFTVVEQQGGEDGISEEGAADGQPDLEPGADG
ncbi:DNA gyrase, A subunit [Pseudoroseomonas cervicalis ATCC 49957]|uniref:DNA gyrase subunit A n=2 Tax=Teichococcus cervicalis TaxID=204525 RepID=D5RPN1_9PROT|nr:DNA gyrase, A subunit [Pseudoroseomonas cervicalis ATCC 49957]